MNDSSCFLLGSHECRVLNSSFFFSLLECTVAQIFTVVFPFAQRWYGLLCFPSHADTVRLYFSTSAVRWSKTTFPIRLRAYDFTFLFFEFVRSPSAPQAVRSLISFLLRPYAHLFILKAYFESFSSLISIVFSCSTFLILIIFFQHKSFWGRTTI